MSANNSKRNKVLLFQWRDSAYDSLRYLQDLLGEEFQKLGIPVDRVIIGEEGWQFKLQNMLNNEEVLFAMGFSGVGADIYTDKNQLIWEATRTPFFNWCCDHPSYYPQRHAIKSQWLIHGFVFPDHARYSCEHFNATGMTTHLHLAMPSADSFEKTHVPLNQRNGRIIYTKSGKDTNNIEESWKRFPSPIQDILKNASEELFNQTTNETYRVICKIAAEHGLFLSGDNSLMMTLNREIDAYIRFKRANLVIESLLDMPIDVYGVGWDHIDWNKAKAAKYHGPIALADTRNLLPYYLGSLSIHPFVTGSVHDRNFFAIAANVVPISDTNEYSKLMMPNLEKYSFKFEKESIRNSVKNLIDEPILALSATELTRENLAKTLTLSKSAQLMLDWIGLVNVNIRFNT